MRSLFLLCFTVNLLLPVVFARASPGGGRNLLEPLEAVNAVLFPLGIGVVLAAGEEEGAQKREKRQLTAEGRDKGIIEGHSEEWSRLQKIRNRARDIPRTLIKSIKEKLRRVI